MSIFNDKALKSVAEAAAKIMAETSHGSHPKTPKEKSLAALAHPKDKITHKDVLVGRGVLKKEDVEQLDEVGDTPAGRKALGSYVSKAIADKSKDRTKGLRKATSRMYKDDYYGKKTNEEVEQLDEYESKDGTYKHKGSYGYQGKGVEHGQTDYGKKDLDDLKGPPSPKRASKGYGARQNMGMRGQSTGEKKKKVNESLSFTEMLELYNEHGLKVLSPIETEEMDIDGTTVEVIDADQVNGVVETAIEEEATEEEFNKELKDQQASFEGKKKQPKVAAGKTTGVKIMPEEVELQEATPDFKTKEDAVKHAKEQVKTHRDRDEGIEIHAHKGGFSVNHTHNWLGRQHLEKQGAKHVGTIYREEVELDERTLTSGESKKKEEYVKGMKKSLSGFKQRYGERAKSVMYATATKMAKKD